MAKAKQRDLTVEVRDKILWIGSDAYPVLNIARAQAREVVPEKQKSPILEFLKVLAKWLLLGFVVALLAGVAHAKPDWFIRIWLVVAVRLLIALMQLIWRLRKKQTSYYALVIETAGTASEALVSDNKSVILEIIEQIMKAINGEAVNWSHVVHNYYGDHFNQIGNNNSINKGVANR